MDKKGFLDDSNGNKSSKRLVGSILTGFGITLKCILFSWGLHHLSTVPLADFATRLTSLDGIADSLIYAGSAVLGVGVFEFFKKGENDK